MQAYKRVFWGTILLTLGTILIGQVGETRDIYEAYRDGKIDIEVRGDGIERIGGRVSRKAGSGPMVLRIPPGTLFEPGGGGVQNMVVTEGTTVNLTASRSAAFTAAVACTDLHLAVPGGADQFAVGRLPPRKAEVVKFFPVASRAGAPYEVKQAGVWIVTDDADYDALGILVGGFFGANLRSINEDEAANAMMLLEKSGIDVTSRSIWRDRLQICNSVIAKGSAASAWCGKIFRDTTDASWKVAALGDSRPTVRRIAQTTLLQAKDEDSRATLINALTTSEPESDSALVTLAQALGNFAGPEVGDALLPLLKDKPAAVKTAAIQSLTKIKDLRATESIRPLMAEPEVLAVRLAAIRSLGAIGSADEDLQALKKAASTDSSPQVKTAASLAIQQFSRRSRSVQ